MAVPDIKETVDNVSRASSQKPPSNGTESDKEAFLSSFSAAESKAIIRKVDRRFLLIIGMMYLIKNVSLKFYSSIAHVLTGIDRLYQCCVCKSIASWPETKHSQRVAYDCRSVQLGTIHILCKSRLMTAISAFITIL
jgi:hypothetical protein